MVPVTVVIPTLNEGHQIAEAVGALSWADEVIVVDGGSTDDTARLAEEKGARVISLQGATIGGQRNAGIEAARNRWILALDADERPSPELPAELESTLAAPRHAAYTIHFRNFFLDRELRHGAFGRDWHVRLFTAERRYTTTWVHERLETIADVGRLRATIHNRSYRDFRHYMRKVVQYARWGADDLAARGRRVTMWDVVFRPWWRFVRDYFVWRGFLDGREGFLLSAFAAVGTLMKYSYRVTEQDARGAEGTPPPRFSGRARHP